MPHALIGYAGSTVRAAEMFHETFPGETMTVLVDYFGQEVSDALAVCRPLSRSRRGGKPRRPRSTRMAAAMSRSSISRAPTPCSSGTRPMPIRGYRTEEELRHLVGTGVCAAALWHCASGSTARDFPA